METATELTFPYGFAWDAAGRTYIPNESSNRVTIYGNAAAGNAAPVDSIAGSAAAFSGVSSVAIY